MGVSEQGKEPSGAGDDVGEGDQLGGVSMDERGLFRTVLDKGFVSGEMGQELTGRPGILGQDLIGAAVSVDPHHTEPG